MCEDAQKHDFYFLFKWQNSFFFLALFCQISGGTFSEVVNSNNCPNCLDCVQNERAREEGTVPNSAGQLGASLTPHCTVLDLSWIQPPGTHCLVCGFSSPKAIVPLV